MSAPLINTLFHPNITSTKAGLVVFWFIPVYPAFKRCLRGRDVGRKNLDPHPVVLLFHKWPAGGTITTAILDFCYFFAVHLSTPSSEVTFLDVHVTDSICASWAKLLPVSLPVGLRELTMTPSL